MVQFESPLVKVEILQEVETSLVKVELLQKDQKLTQKLTQRLTQRLTQQLTQKLNQKKKASLMKNKGIRLNMGLMMIFCW